MNKEITNALVSMDLDALLDATKHHPTAHQQAKTYVEIHNELGPLYEKNFTDEQREKAKQQSIISGQLMVGEEKEIY